MSMSAPADPAVHQPCPCTRPSMVHAYGLGYIHAFGQGALPQPLFRPWYPGCASKVGEVGGNTGLWACHVLARVYSRP